ncbi:MAG TPA: polysaccharide deacetylase family protein [Kofleriaceae bacterium]|nr:polysaccharide deacetylase family protein [Kofleriaceae bacterium]
MIVLGLLAAGLAGDADAKGWPHPAAGESPTGDIEVLFTFDDGPHVATTPLVLDILAQHKIHAVFFLIGRQIEDNPKVHEILQRIIDEGHIIANHTMNHTNLCKSKLAEAVEDVDSGRERIEQATSMKIEWFRAPFGVRCDQLDEMLAERRTFHFHWDLDPQEWKHGNAERAVKYVTGELSRATGRNVLLMHDIKLATVKALPEILAWIDEENARRRAARRRPIKILQAPAYAIERLPPELVGWLGDASAGVRALPKRLAGVLP